MKQWLKEHGLSIVLFTFFLVFLFGQSLAGHGHYNEEQAEHGQPTVSYTEYLTSGDFIEATFENWESEFLQMGAYVILTVFLYQKGSAESKKLQGSELVDAEPRNSKHAPWPVRVGGVVQKLYENSLSLAFLLLFLMSFWLHAVGGATVTCEESLVHGERDCPSVVSYMGTSKFWSESFQNWQSEFLAVGSIVVLSVYLRQRGSPESKPVNTPNDKTGSE
jgi:hypothetical protein